MASVSARAATVQGLGAVLLWALLASFTALSGPVPPLMLTAIAFAIATLVGVVHAWTTGASLAVLATVPARAWAFGLYGLLGFHAAYFLAVKTAPPLEVTIINYTWPLLIVLFSALLPAGLGGRRLAWWHVAGALLGFSGAALIPLTSTTALGLGGSALGYAAAVGSALIWSSYSVGSRLFAAVPTVAVTGSCALTALAALAGHLAFETTAWPATPLQWLVVVLQGLGPVGLAFYLWDVGMKHGDIRLLGAIAYVSPILSTLLLALLGLGTPSAWTWLAALLVTAGASLAGRDNLRRQT